MVRSINSSNEIKKFQQELMQSFIDTALEAKMEEHLIYPSLKKVDKSNKGNRHTKKTVRSDTGNLETTITRNRD